MNDLQNNFIGGEWVGSDAVIENRNPARPDDLIGVYARADAAQVADAVAAAKAAQPAWAAASPQVRSDVLARAGAAILSRVEDLGRLLAREEGKTLAEAKGGHPRWSCLPVLRR